MSTSSTTITGYEVAAVEAWIAAHVTGLTPPLRWTRLEGGHSNLTYRLDDAQGRSAVIRRPPMGELLPKAHDMEREWQLISALGPTPVPVPAALGLCTDRSVTGAIFYVMGLGLTRDPYQVVGITNMWIVLLLAFPSGFYGRHT